MLTWLVNNLATIIVGLALLAVVILIVKKLRSDKKKGKSSCGCGCSDCPMSGSCNPEK